MLGHGGSSAGSYLADPYFPHPLALFCHYPVSKCRSASIAVTGTLRVTDKQFFMGKKSMGVNLHEVSYLLQIILTLTVLVTTIDAL